MKYIKLFEEHSNIYDFCEDYLAYLLDDKTFKISIQENKTHIIGDGVSGQSIQIKSNRRCNTIKLEKYLYKPDGFGGGRRKNINFTWDEIKDDFIPFLIMLDSEYGVVRISFSVDPHRVKGVYKNKNFKTINMKDIEGDIDISMNEIYVTVKN